VKAETESEIIATQDQALQTKYHWKDYYKPRQTANAGYQLLDETVENITSACPILAKEQYIKRHDKICAQLNFNICHEIGIKLDKEHWYEQVPKLAERSREYKITILWNEHVHVDRTIPNNILDIIIHPSGKWTRMLIDVAILWDRNMTKITVEKILQYKDLTIKYISC